MKKYILLSVFTLSVIITAAKSDSNLFVNDSITEIKLDSLQLITYEELLEQQFKKYDHVKYRFAGKSENGFDCSGFVGTVFKNVFEIKLPRSSREMLHIGKEIPKNELKIGDLIIFKPPGYSHVGIYLGDGVFMHSSTRLGVTKSSIDSTYWKKYYKTSRRVLTSNE